MNMTPQCSHSKKLGTPFVGHRIVEDVDIVDVEVDHDPERIARLTVDSVMSSLGQGCQSRKTASRPT